jgi:hypothetical protein
MTRTTGTTSAGMTTVQLPADLAPSLAERLLRLLSEVTLTHAPDVEFAVPSNYHGCVVCHRSGKLGGHHAADGRIQWVHAKCHRRLHRSGRHDVVLPAHSRSRYAC